MNWPLITIVTPSFNQARFLEDTLRSIHDQNYPNLEHIVIDGGSTDGSVDIIRSYAHKLAFWVSEPDQGQTDALIKGFQRATGDILGWLNSDDLYEPYTLREVAQFFMNNPDAKFVYGDAVWIDRDGKILEPKREIPFNWFVWLHTYNYIPQPSAFWRRDLYEEVGGLDRRFDLAMDADLWARFAEHTKPIHVRRVWSRMRLYPEQKNRRLREISNLEDEVIRSRYVRHMTPHGRKLRRLVARLLRISWKAVYGCYIPGV